MKQTILRYRSLLMMFCSVDSIIVCSYLSDKKAESFMTYIIAFIVIALTVAPLQSWLLKTVIYRIDNFSTERLIFFCAISVGNAFLNRHIYGTNLFVETVLWGISFWSTMRVFQALKSRLIIPPVSATQLDK